MISTCATALRNSQVDERRVTEITIAGKAFPLKLNAKTCQKLSEAQISQELLPLIRSNVYSIDVDKLCVFIDGPDTSYHSLDPYLETGLEYFGLNLKFDNVGQFWSVKDAFDVCMEDSWCGRFLATHLQLLPANGPVNNIHLDDHTDMMSTLMAPGRPLINPLTDHEFQPTEPADWDDAIISGAIGIGSFLTSFYNLERPVHIMHLREGLPSLEKYRVQPAVRTHRLLEEASFFDIQLSQETDLTGFTHTYSSSSKISDLLHDANSQRYVVHIDLDYFINDFNGNPVASGYQPSASLREAADQKMNAFFDGLQEFDVTIDRWMIATSPGFCSGYHWQYLMENLSERINRLSSANFKFSQT